MPPLEVEPPAEAVFDRFASTYEETVGNSVGFSGLAPAFFTAAKAGHLLRVAQTVARPAEEVEALDVGCGTGALDRLLAPHMGRLVGVDVSPAMIDRARCAGENIEYLTYDACRLPFEAGSFDMVFAVCVLHHVPPGLRPQFLAEMWRVTRPGGVTVVVEHNPLNFLTRLSVRNCPLDEGVVLTGPGRVRTMLRDLGAPRSRTTYILFLPWVGAVVTSLERRLLGRLPLGAQYMVEAFKPAEEPMS